MASPRYAARRPNGSPKSLSRSIRCVPEVWEPAKARTESEGVTMSYALTALLDGYARGLIDLPNLTLTYPVATRAS